MRGGSMSIFLRCVLGFSLISLPLFAQDVDSSAVVVPDTLLEIFDDEDDLLSGFDEETAVKTQFEKEKFWSLTGDIRLSPSFNYDHQTHRVGLESLPIPILPQVISENADYRGLTRLRLKNNLKLEIKLPRNWKIYASSLVFYDFAYRIKNRDDFSQQTLDAYESEFELQEAYIQGSPMQNLDLRIGRQVINWGRADNIRVLDVLNPLDLREPGMVDIEDLRLPVTMSRIDYLFGKWTLTGAAIHEIRFNKFPAYGSEFYPLPIEKPHETIPENSFENTEFAFALRGTSIFPATDFSLHFARFFDDAFHLKIKSPEITLQHSKLNLVGASLGIARGSWLLKSELAYIDGLEYATVSDNKSRIDMLAGFEYNGFKNTTLAMDIVNRHVHEHEEKMAAAPDQISENDMQLVLTLRKDFMRETWHFMAVAALQDDWGEKGAYERISLSYDWSDNLEFMAGSVQYQSGDLLLSKQAADNDRVFFEVKYSF
ncbi:MAG: DUF1302 family protein [Calditrichaeota bacterium]|nr:MAG: DUF1302 family protein [Calditrichota bacterium]